MRSFSFQKAILAGIALSFLSFNIYAADPQATVSISPVGPYVSGNFLTGSYVYSDTDLDPENVGALQHGWYRSNSPTGSSPSLITSNTNTISLDASWRGTYIAYGVIVTDNTAASSPLTFSNWYLVNALPQPTDDNYTNLSDEGDDLVIPAPGVLGNDNSGGDGQSIEAYLVNPPAYGSLTLNTDGSFTYSHNGSENYTDVFTYRVFDGMEYSATNATVNIQVLSVNDAPRFTSDSITTATQEVEYTYNITTSDAEGNSRSVSSIIKPDWLVLTSYANGNARLQGTPGNDDVGDHPVTLRVTDIFSDYSEQSFIITVADVNDLPVLDGIELTNLNYTEEDPARIISSLIVLDDPDDDPIDSAKVSFFSGYVDTEDRFSFTPLPPLSGHFDQATGIYHIYGPASETVFQTALRNVRYVNSNTINPDDGNRIVDFRVYTGIDSSNIVYRTINFTAVNDAPDVNPDIYNNVPEGGTLIVNASNDVLENDEDLDGPSPMVAYLNTGVTYGSLIFNSDGTFTYNHNGSNELSDGFTYYVSDTEDQSGPVTVTINMIPSNDAPVLANIESSTLVYEEDTDPVQITATITLEDEDDNFMESARVTIDQGFVTGEDSLTFSEINNMAISYNPSTGELVATGHFNLQTYRNQLLRNIRYYNTNSDDPDTRLRRVSFVVNDGEEDSNLETRFISISPVNDPPEASNAELTAANFYVGELVQIQYDYTDPENDPEGSTVFRWYTATNAQGDGRAIISGWQTDTFSLRISEGGKYVSAVVRPFDNVGDEGLYDTTEWVYINAAPEFQNFKVVNNNIANSFAVGQVVSADYTYFDKDNDLAGTHEYQWYQSINASWNNAAEIDGQTSSDLELISDLEGSYIGVEGIPHARSGSPEGQVYRSLLYRVSEAPSGTISTFVDSICEGDIATLSVSLSGGTDPWAFKYVLLGTVDDTIEVTGVSSATAYPLQVTEEGTYVLVDLHDSDDPYGVADISGEATISFYPQPTASFPVESVAICQGDDTEFVLPVEMEGKSPWRITYRRDSETPVIRAGLVDPIYEISVSEASLGTYTLLEVADINCTATIIDESAIVEEKQNPKVTLSGNPQVCPGEEAPIVFTLQGDGPWVYYYSFNNGPDQTVVVNESGPQYADTLKVTELGTYRVTGVEAGGEEGCASGTAEVLNFDLPTAEISGNDSTCAGTAHLFPITLTGDAPWNLVYRINSAVPDTISNIFNRNYQLAAYQAGNYALLSVEDAHCVGVTNPSDIAYLKVNNLPEVSIFGMDTVYSQQQTSVPVNVNPIGGNFNASSSFIPFDLGSSPYTMNMQWALMTGGTPFDIRYSYPDPVTGCIGVDEHTVFIIDSVAEIQVANSKNRYCTNDGVIKINGVNLRRKIGSFSISGNKGLVDSANNVAYLYPKEIGAGNKTVTYLVEIDGEIESDQMTFSFDEIHADFTWDNECLVDSAIVVFQDNSTSYFENLVAWDWKFYIDDDTLKYSSENEPVSPEITFHDLGAYNIEYIAISEYNMDRCYDTIKQPFTIKPTYDINSNRMPYDESFTGGFSDWETASSIKDSINSWRYGKPAGTVWDALPSAERAWYTEIDDATQWENSYVISPCFDFTGSTRPMLKFDLWRRLSPNDGANIQYTLDNGKNWHNIGEKGDGISWFNSSGINGNPGGNPNGWTDRYDNEWVNARHKLDMLKGQEQVRFRVNYGSPLIDIIETEGLAFDNFWIGERTKKVLIEHFTNNSDTASARINPILNSLLNSDEHALDVIDIQYHLGEPNFGEDIFNEYNASDPESRGNVYQVNTVPYSVIDGGRSDPQFLINHQGINTLNAGNDDKLTLAALADNIFNINMQVVIVAGSIGIEVEANEAQPDMDLTLHVVIVENVIEGVQANNGESHFESVMREMLPNSIGTSISGNWNKGEKRSFDFNYDFDGATNFEQLRVVAFIQDNETREVYQASMLNPSGSTNAINTIDESSFTVYPNPAQEYTTILFAEPTHEELRMEIVDLRGAHVHTMEIYPGIQSVTLPIGQLTPGIYTIRIVGESSVIGVENLIKTGFNR